MYAVEYGEYPTALSGPGTDNTYCPSGPTVDDKYCFKLSPGNTLASGTPYTRTTSTFSLDVTNTDSSTTYRITESTPPALAAATTPPSCPTGFIPVPGSVTYGTSDFCVMKYEAKQVGTTNVPISQASGIPWSPIPQPTAIINSQNVADCTGCHLITEAEWMTIAQNVLNNPVNWSSGVVGSGYIYSGHNDGSPFNPIAADSNDSNNYVNTGNLSGNQRRTLVLSNGEIIWDMAGNINEWTSGTTNGGQPGIDGGGYAWREWTDITNNGSLSTNLSPDGTGIPGANGWNSIKGIGQIVSSSDEVNLRGILHGGHFNSGAYAGVLSLLLNYDTTVTNWSGTGFRVAK